MWGLGKKTWMSGGGKNQNIEKPVNLVNQLGKPG